MVLIKCRAWKNQERSTGRKQRKFRDFACPSEFIFLFQGGDLSHFMRTVFIRRRKAGKIQFQKFLKKT